MAYKRVFRKRSPTHNLSKKAARSLGYKSLGHYLASDLWRSVGARAKADAKYCYCCGSQYPKYPHLIRHDNRTMTGLSTEGIAVLCYACNWDLRASDGNTPDVIRTMRANKNRPARLPPSQKAVTLHAELGKVPRLPQPVVNKPLSGNPGQESVVQDRQVPKA